MLRLILVMFLCLFNQEPVAAQQKVGAEYSSFRTDNLSPRELAIKLTQSKSTEYEKVRSIFEWITENISYRSQQFSRRNASSFQIEDDTSAILKPLNERVSEIVLRNKLAVCDGYARLFKTLCDFAGIRAEIVTGFVRNSSRASARFQTNHSWNAVMIDGKWYLADPTWASGYVNYSGQFHRQYDPDFFLADPAGMLQTHYPENPFWTLMDDHKAPAEFHKQPLKYFAWHGSYINSYSPASGIIDVRPGEAVSISLTTKEKKNDLVLTTHPFFFVYGSPSSLQRNYTIEAQTITGIWMPENNRAEWLYVVFNGEVIMRYSLRYN